MKARHFPTASRRGTRLAPTLLMLLAVLCVPAAAAAPAAAQTTANGSAATAVAPATPAAEAPATEAASLGGPGLGTPKTPIQHLVVLMQENHSFDNYFGQYPGAAGIPLEVCMAIDPAEGRSAGCVAPFHLEQDATQNLAHNATVFRRQYRAGRMTGFVAAHRELGVDGSLAMGYYDGSDLPVYYNLADEYVLFDHFFSSAAGGSIRNYMFWVTASPGGRRDVIPEGGWGDIPTIFDRLQARGISWKFYVQDYDTSATFRSAGGVKTQVVRVPLLAYERYLDNPELASHIVGLNQYYQDLRAGTLPAVSYIVAAAASEHPPSNIQSGQRLVRSLVTELQRNSAWSSSAFLLTYSNWGGWYDHVTPPQVDEAGYGFRVPALLVSPYARKGHIESTQLDFTSILRFIEDNYGLEPLTHRDAAANSIAPAFDFSQAPRPAQVVPMQRTATAAAAPQPKRAGVLVAYAWALILPAVCIGWAIRTSRRPRRPMALVQARLVQARLGQAERRED